MINIVGPRGSGKTTQLFEKAKELNAMILTTNSRALREKARAKGYKDLEIIGFGDLDNDNFSFRKTLLVDNGEYVLRGLLNKFYGLDMIGFTATMED